MSLITSIFCDRCEKQINSQNIAPATFAVETKLSGAAFGKRIIQVGLSDLENNIHICRYCLLDSINKDWDNRSEIRTC